MSLIVLFLSLVILASSESSKTRILKYPKDSKAHDAVGATYQAITKRHYSGAPSSATTAEVLNTITSPHSSSSVSFTSTSVDHAHAQAAHAHYPAYPTTAPPPSQPYHLQNIIVNDQEHAVHDTQLPMYIYRISPNQTAGYETTPRVSPKAFSYQPVITLANNMKTFYKVNQYTPFVIPPNQYDPNLYSNSYEPNSVYTPSTDYYKSYPSKAYPAKYLFPSPVLSYNVSAYPSYEGTPAPAIPPPEGYSLVQGVAKAYRDNAYIEPERSQYRPVLLLNNYAS